MWLLNESRIPEPLTSEEAREAISALSLLKITKMDMKLVCPEPLTRTKNMGRLTGIR